MNGEEIPSLEPNEIVILIALYRAQMLNLADIRRILGKGKLTSSRYAETFIYLLKEKDLIEEIKYKRYRFFKLTGKGLKIAKELDKVYK